MIIDEETIIARRTELETEMKNVQDQMSANLNAFRGAIQQCDYFLDILTKVEEEKDE